MFHGDRRINRSRSTVSKHYCTLITQNQTVMFSFQELLVDKRRVILNGGQGVTLQKIMGTHVHSRLYILRYIFQMNNYIVRSYSDVIVITKFAIIKFAIRRASKAQSIVMYWLFNTGKGSRKLGQQLQQNTTSTLCANKINPPPAFHLPHLQGLKKYLTIPLLRH